MFKNPVQEENKNLCKDQTCNASGLKTCFCSVRRGNQWTICKVCRNSKTNTVDCMGRQPQTFKTFHSNQSCSQTSSVFSDVIREKSHRQVLSSSIEKEASGFSVTITSQWCTCLNKCIDASPLVIHSPGRCEGEVFIGSHAHVFMCIRLSDGEVLWERRVGDRIESSAALSVCGKFVTVGTAFILNCSFTCKRRFLAYLHRWLCVRKTWIKKKDMKFPYIKLNRVNSCP